MSYLVLARKYRPITFEDLTGQEQVRRTLTKALETGRVAHAYLFTGPRGVGKTTAARLLAMALACQSPGPKPCGTCPNCLEIQNGECVDLMEVDGASNRGINEIRGLRDTVKYLPAKNPYKVYIIDEVHALTNEAFNALLKTLEEPPAHVIFIFATTEAHKVPATILSRCQRYDFKRIRADEITERLLKVAQTESIHAEPEALTIIARQAEGGLRDALGLMDQVIASAGEITPETVDQALGLINQNLVSQTAQAAFRGDTKEALDLMEKAYNLGSDFRELGARILEYVRGLTLYKANAQTATFLDLTEKEISEYQKVGQNLSLSFLHRHFEAWLKFQANLARHPQPRWLMEAHLIKLCQTAPLTDLAALTARLTALLEGSPDLLKKNLELLTLEAQKAPTAPVAQPPTGATAPVSPKALASATPRTPPLGPPAQITPELKPAPTPPVSPAAPALSGPELPPEPLPTPPPAQLPGPESPPESLPTPPPAQLPEPEPAPAVNPEASVFPPPTWPESDFMPKSVLTTDPLEPEPLSPPPDLAPPRAENFNEVFPLNQASPPPREGTGPQNVLGDPRWLDSVELMGSPFYEDLPDYSDFQNPVPPLPQTTISDVELKKHVDALKENPIIKAFSEAIGGKISSFDHRALPLSPMLNSELVDESEEDEEFDEGQGKDVAQTEETD
ncbi:MAG: DNA polymerase III subunit gamma/tau [Deltaproteobacteria bacterium]|jgi:DNA polymerase-3 subunit gamma/tau|nr:DNA polymerase III subunit gamma/tau [Deltaproteobacteria bacterium]